MRKVAGRFLAGLAVLVMAGCSSPNPVLFTLATIPGTALTGAPHTIQVRRVGLAGYLDRPGIVRATNDYQLSIASDERWGEPLGGMLTRVLDQDLSQRLPGSTVYADSGAISADPDLILEIDVQRFDAGSDGMVVIAAEISARPGDRSDRAVTRSVRLTVTPQSSATTDYAAALSRGLGQLADIVAGLCVKRTK
jgi:uncharacterized lipoprotein YmbA